MKYEDFVENYSPELQLMDALDAIKNFDLDAAEILDRWASQSSTEKSVSESPRRIKISKLPLQILNRLDLVRSTCVGFRQVEQTLTNVTFVRRERRNFLICGVIEVKLRASSVYHLLPTTKPNPIDVGTPLTDNGRFWSVAVD